MRGEEMTADQPAPDSTRPSRPKTRVARKAAWSASVALAALLSGCGNGTAVPTAPATPVTDGITLELARRGRRWLVSRLLWY